MLIDNLLGCFVQYDDLSSHTRWCWYLHQLLISFAIEAADVYSIMISSPQNLRLSHDAQVFMWMTIFKLWWHGRYTFIVINTGSLQLSADALDFSHHAQYVQFKQLIQSSCSFPPSTLLSIWVFSPSLTPSLLLGHSQSQVSSAG